MTSAENQQQQAPRALDAVAACFATRGRLAGREGAQTVGLAREHAERSLAAYDAPIVAEHLAAPLAGSLLASLLVERRQSEAELSALLAELAGAAVAPLDLLRETLRAPALVTLAPAEALQIALALLVACASLRQASLWAPGAAGPVHCVARGGEGPPSRVAGRLARAAIAGGAAALPATGEMHVIAIRHGGEPLAALVARSRRGVRARAAAAVHLAEASAPLAAILEREMLLARSAAGERMLLAASERRLTRLGFDLHDGPLQELLLVGEDLALFRQQVAVVLEGRRGKELLGGRLDDLDARLVSLERGLRRISSAVHSDVLVTRPFAEAIADLLEQFAARSGIEASLRSEGEMDTISTSQRLAVLNVVGEALNNVREHGRASVVEVAVALDHDGVRACVRDDGRGFDVERELLRAARTGHMGLAGMHERVRLLDGHCRVDSRPGGPTEVTLTLPRWHGALGGVATAAAGEINGAGDTPRGAARRG
jgi:signal transduction histidine kinase